MTEQHRGQTMSDERDAAREAASEKWQKKEGGGMSHGLRAYHSIFEEGFDAGYAAHADQSRGEAQAERERLLEKLFKILPHHPECENPDEHSLMVTRDYGTPHDSEVCGCGCHEIIEQLKEAE